MEVVGRIAAGVAHDFNNILTAIRSFTQFAQEAAADRPEVVSDLAEVQVASERAAGLTRQLLTFTRTSRSEPSRVDLNEARGRRSRRGPIEGGRPRARAVLMSGYTPEALAHRGAGAPREILRKPFTPEELLERVRAAFVTA